MYNISNKGDFNELHDRLNTMIQETSELYQSLEETSQFEFAIAFHGSYLEYTVKIKYLNELIIYATIYKNMEPYEIESYIYLRAGYYLKYKIENDENARKLYEENTRTLLCLI